MAEIYRSDIVRVDLDHALLRKHVGAILVTGDKLGNRFGAEIFRDGKPVDVTGCGVTAYFMRPGEDAIVLNGTASGSVVYVDLAQACYSKASSFTLTIKISCGGATTALRVIDGYILLTQTDDLVDPGDVVPTLDDIFAQIATMEQAAQRANSAAELAITAKDNANGAAVYAVTIAREAAQELMTTSAPPIIPTATGSIVHIADGAARPAVEVISHIEPVQEGSGEASPNNVRTISGRNSLAAKHTGRNMVKPAFGTVTTDGITLTSNGDGSVTITGTANSTVGQRISDNSMDVFLPKGINYHLFLADTAPNAAITLQVYVDGQSKFNAQNGYLTIPETASSAYLRIRVAAGVEINETIHPMVTLDNEASWEEGHAQVLDAGLTETVYGGKRNWTTGELTSTHQIKELDGTDEWSGPDMIKNGTYRYLTVAAMASNLLVPPTNDDMPDAVCSHFVAQPYNELYNGGVIGFSWTQGRKLSIRCNFETAEELNAYLAAQKAAGTPVTIAYPVINPQKVTLTPQQLETLKGINNVWSDCGDTTLSYVADTELWATQKFAAIAAAMLAN